MKIPNLLLALGLADHALVRHSQSSEPLGRAEVEALQLSDYLLTHPTSRVFTERALLEMGVHPDTVPGEVFADDVPDEAYGAAKLKEAIAVLNAQWGRNKLARFIAVRNLAWQAQQLARRLEKDCNEDAERVIKRNNGSTAGLFASLVPSVTRAELHAMRTPINQENQNA